MLMRLFLACSIMKTPNLVIGIVLLVLSFLFFTGAGVSLSGSCAETPVAARVFNLPECSTAVAVAFALGFLGLIFLIISAVVFFIGRTKTPISQYSYSPNYQTPATYVLPTAVPPARYCSSCGNQLMASAAYCAKCGAKV